MAVTLEALRRYAVARTLFAPTTLVAAVERLGGFVQADPLRAPARAQDLILRHRVARYRAGELERRYPELPLQEDYFINYGFLTPALRAHLHPREARVPWDEARWQRARKVLERVRALGEAHPSAVDAALRQGTVKNWFGGKSRSSTELLDGLHYRGHLDVARREGGVRCYRLAAPWAPKPEPQAAMDALVDAVVQTYAPLPGPSLGSLVAALGRAAPQWRQLRAPTLARAKARLAHAVVEGVAWHWPAAEDPGAGARIPTRVRLLAPFDPLVWDRRRFELLWGWPYRFEAYTPAERRVRGHYALPLLFREHVIGWANLRVEAGRLRHELGFVGRRPREAAFTRALDAELEAMSVFLGL
jgi:uncharacterized protein YcaQ